jgi:hypothetical protein
LLPHLLLPPLACSLAPPIGFVQETDASIEGGLPLTPDFAKLILGHNGQHPTPPNPALLPIAERWMVNNYATTETACPVASAIVGSDELKSDLESLALALSAGPLSELRAAEVHKRISELERCESGGGEGACTYKELLEREMKLSGQVDDNGATLSTVADRISMYKRELEGSSCQPRDGSIGIDLESYTQFLKGDPLPAAAQSEVAARWPALVGAVTGGADAVLVAVRKVAPKTLSLQELKTSEVAESTAFVEALDEEWVLGLSAAEKRQWTVIHAKFQMHPLKIFQR